MTYPNESERADRNAADEPMSPAAARRLDDEIEDARREELLAERRTALRDRLAGLPDESRETLRCLIDLAAYSEAAYRAEPDGDDREIALDLIDEAEAYASGPTEPDEQPATGLVPGMYHDLGADFRGLTATAGSVVQGLGLVDPAAQVWVRVKVGDVEHIVPVDGLWLCGDDSVHLTGPGAHS